MKLIWLFPKRLRDYALVGQLPSPVALRGSAVVANRADALWENVAGHSS
jgi:hypothetical protein